MQQHDNNIMILILCSLIVVMTVYCLYDVHCLVGPAGMMYTVWWDLLV